MSCPGMGWICPGEGWVRPGGEYPLPNMGPEKGRGGYSPPSPQWDLGNGRQAVGTHPTGMLSCY